MRIYETKRKKKRSAIPLAVIIIVLLTVLFIDISYSADGGKSEMKNKKKAEALKAGDEAPDFTLKDQDGKDVELKKLRGEGLTLLAFYPKDDSPICSKEMKEFRDAHDEFEKLGVRILGISTNSQESHEKFQKKHALPFPLLSDGKGEVSKSYGAYNKLMGVSQRSYFLVDGDGVLQYVFVEKSNAQHRKNETLLKEVEKVISKKKKSGDNKGNE